MTRSWLRALALGYLMATMSGCSIVLALNGTHEPDFDAFAVGSSREQVEAQLGLPKLTEVQSEGARKDTYEVEIGNSPNAGRATFNFYMDLATIGIWELPGTIIEATMGEMEQIHVTYDRDNRVTAIDGYRPPAPTAAMKDAMERQKALEQPSRRPDRVKPVGHQPTAAP